MQFQQYLICFFCYNLLWHPGSPEGSRIFFPKTPILVIGLEGKKVRAKKEKLRAVTIQKESSRDTRKYTMKDTEMWLMGMVREWYNGAMEQCRDHGMAGECFRIGMGTGECDCLDCSCDKW